jgi:hypothetical protein
MQQCDIAFTQEPTLTTHPRHPMAACGQGINQVTRILALYHGDHQVSYAILSSV